MTSTLTRRPLPALVSLLALLLLAALVWWRVLHRDAGGASDAKSACPTPTSTPAAVLPAPASITVKVLNSTDRAGIAARARTTLVADGFKVPTPAGNDSPKVSVLGTAEIRYGPTGRKAATVLGYYFPGSKLVANSTGSATVVVSLGDNYQRIATPSAVRAAMTRDNVKLATGTPAAPSTRASASC